MLHRVLPAFRERYCLTVWLDGAEGVNSDQDLQVRPVVFFPSCPSPPRFVLFSHTSCVSRTLTFPPSPL